MSSTRALVAPFLFLVPLALGSCSQSPSQSPPQASTSAPPPAQPPATPAPEPAPAGDASRNEGDTPPAITDADLPPLPVTPFPAARPAEVVRSVYSFAAKHPEVLSKVPCFCGCERMGHRQNDDCFVAARDARGRVTAWEPHGVG